jgi:hypothetical protein
MLWLSILIRLDRGASYKRAEEIADWRDILINFLGFPQIIGETLPYDTIQQIRGRLNEVSPNLTRYGLLEPANFFKESASYAEKARGAAAKGVKIDVSIKVGDFG